MLHQRGHTRGWEEGEGLHRAQGRTQHVVQAHTAFAMLPPHRGDGRRGRGCIEHRVGHSMLFRHIQLLLCSLRARGL